MNETDKPFTSTNKKPSALTIVMVSINVIGLITIIAIGLYCASSIQKSNLALDQAPTATPTIFVSNTPVPTKNVKNIQVADHMYYETDKISFNYPNNWNVTFENDIIEISPKSFFSGCKDAPTTVTIFLNEYPSNTYFGIDSKKDKRLTIDGKDYLFTYEIFGEGGEQFPNGLRDFNDELKSYHAKINTMTIEFSESKSSTADENGYITRCEPYAADLTIAENIVKSIRFINTKVAP